MKWWAKSFHYQPNRISNYERPLEVSVTEARVVNRRDRKPIFISSLSLGDDRITKPGVFPFAHDPDDSASRTTE
jgi:hypothetical protein